MGSGMVDEVPDETREKYFLDAAQVEIPEAHKAMSEYYCDMKFSGCKNRDKAWYWLNKAAEHNYPRALGQLAMIYEHGDSVPIDYAQAFNYYKKTADLGFEYAHKNACRLLKNGLHTDNNYIKACNAIQ